MTSNESETCFVARRRGPSRTMLVSFFGTLAAMSLAAVAALRTAPTVAVPCGNSYSVGVLGTAPVAWTAAPWVGGPSTYPGQTATNDCAAINYGQVTLNSTNIQVAGLAVTSTGVTSRLQVGSGGNLNIIGDGLLSSTSTAVPGQLWITGGSVAISSGTQSVNNAGEILVNNSGNLTTLATGGLVVNSGGVLNVGQAASPGVITAANSGIKIAAGASANINNGTLDGAGSWTVGETTIGPTALMTIGNPGTVLIDGPTINVEQSGLISVVTSSSGPNVVTLDNGASIDVNANGTLELVGVGPSMTLQQGVGGGQIDVNVGGAFLSTVNGIANLTVNNGGAVSINGASGDLALNGGGTHNTGVFSNNNSIGTLTLNGNHAATNSLLTGIGAIVNAGSLDLDGSTISGTGTFSNTGTMDFLSGTDTLNTRSVQNPGLLQWSGATVVLENGASIINTATFDITSDSTMIQGAGAAGSFSNPGTVQKTAGGAISTIAIPFTNTGSVDVQSGTIALTGGGSSTGSHTINSSSVLKIGGGSYTMSGGASIGGSGFFDLAAGTLTLNTTGAFALPHFSQGGGTLTGPATLQIVTGGTWNWTGGAQVGSGASTLIDSGAVVNIGVSPKQLDGRSLTNNGSINWLGSTLTFSNGAPFVNGPTGSIVINGSVPLMMDALTGGSFQNDGSVQKIGDTGTTTISTIPVLNNGSLDIQTGILNITGSFSSGPSSSLSLVLGGTTPGTGYSQLSLAPAPTLAGDLFVALNAFAPAGGDTFRLVNIPTGAHVGDFNSPRGYPAPSPGTVWTDTYDANGFLLTAQAVSTSAVVTNLNDSGPGSLRQALADAAGGFCNPCTITFNIPVPGPIPVLSLLPSPTTPIAIDATTQPGYAGTPIVGVDGALCSGCEGLHLQGSSSISGLAVYNFNGGGGVELEGTGSNTVTDSWLGIDLSGAPAPNVYGAFIDSSSGNTISNNVISGNNFGVYASGATASNNTITNNFIGTGPGGTGAIGNTYGVLLDTTSIQNVVISNTIANNASGVVVFDPGSVGNGIKMNSMFSNGIGIDLADDGVTANDAGDGDSGPNGLQNFPVISAVAPGIGTDTVTLSVDSAATSTGSLRVEVFKADGLGQGQTFLGQQCFAGNAITGQNMVLSSNLMGGDSIVSTATSYSDGACTTAMDGTSEFSAAFAVVCPTPVIAITAPPSVCPSATAAASVTAIAGATYSWTIANGTILSGATTNAITFTAGATGSVTLTVMVTSDCGAVNSTSAVVPITPATATITASGPTTFCQGGSVVLTANAASSYLWSNGATTQSIVVSTGGSYSVTVTNAGGCSATSSPVTVTVNPAPAAVISGPASMCQAGGSVTLTVSGSNISSILWSNGATTPSITVSPSTTTTYSVTLTSSAGCSTSLSHTVSVGTGGPALSVLAPASVVAFSSGNAASVLGAPAGIYTWVVFNGQITAGQGTPSITFTAGASGVVSIAVTVEDSSGCASNGAVNVPIDACSTTPPSLVSPAPGASVSSPVTFSWSPVGGATGYDVWRVADGSTPAFVGSSNTTSLSAAVPSGTFSWFVTARLPQACNPSQLESEVRRITVVPSTSCPTAAPVLVSPTSGSAFSPVRFDWEGVAGALGYRLMASLGGLPGAEIDTTDAGTTEVLADIPVGSVRWWVEAIYPGCPPVSSAFANFSVELEECSRHGAATLIGPSDGSSAATSAVTFSWTAVDGADGYAVWVALDEGLSVVGTTVGDLSLTAIIPPGSHEWFVETKFEGCPSTESTRRVINVPSRTNCATSGPSLSSPAPNATVTSPLVTFSWTAVPDAVLYELFLSVAGGSPALIGTTTTTSLTAELPPGEIEWFVRARLNGCPNVESSRRSLAYRPPAACTNTAPIPLMPLDDGRALTSPTTFRWTSVPGASEYHLYLQRGSSSPALTATTTTNEANDVAVPNGESRWFVEAVISGCPPTRSSPSRFRAVPEPNTCLNVAAPVISVPGQVSAGTDFTVQWSSVPGAESYLLTEFIGSTARTLAVDGQSATFSYPNTTAAPITYVYSVRGVDNDCNPAQAGAVSAALGVTILPQRSAEASTVVGTSNTIQQVITIGPEFAGQSFSATPAQPWITVTPRTGVVPAGGIDLVVTADITGLPLGTSIGAVTLTFGSPGAGRATTNNGPVTAPVSVSLVTPVTPTPKSTPPPDALIIPAVAHAQGINAQFQSDVRVSNTSPQTMKYQLTFIPSGEAGMTQGRQATVDIEPGRTLALDDVLRSWFGTSTNSVLGTLEIRPLTQSSSTTSSAAVRGVANLVTFASSRTFNQTPNGTFGTYIAAIPFANFVGRSTGTAPANVLSLQQIAQSSTYRTNLGLVEGSGNPVELLVSVFDTVGSRITQFPVALTGGQHLQLGSFLAQREIQLEDGRLEVQVLSGTGRVTSYASVVNNATGDSLVVTPVALSQSGSSKYVLPGVAELSAGVPWQTDMRLFNAGDQAVTATLTLQSLNGNAPQQATVELAPKQVKQLDRVLATLFGVTNDGGALHITTPGNTNLIATARTFRPAGDGANFGQFIQAVTPNDAIALGSRPLQILQVEESPRFRSNVGIAEVSGQSAKVELTVIPPDAKVSARIEVDMGPNQFRQLNSLLSSMGLTGTHNARVTVKVISGTGRVTAYAATIDAVTQDPTFIPAQ